MYLYGGASLQDIKKLPLFIDSYCIQVTVGNRYPGYHHVFGGASLQDNKKLPLFIDGYCIPVPCQLGLIFLQIWLHGTKAIYILYSVICNDGYMRVMGTVFCTCTLTHTYLYSLPMWVCITCALAYTFLYWNVCNTYSAYGMSLRQ